MSEKQKRVYPAKWVHIPAALLALILTVCLWGTQLSLVGLQTLTSTELHQRAAAAKDVVDLQMERIAGDVKDLAEEYGFSPEPVIELIRREDVEQLDRDIVTWWTGTTSTGKMGEEPEFTLEGAEKVLQADQKFAGGLDPLLAVSTVDRVVIQITACVKKSAVLFRDILVNAGVRMAGERLDLPEAVTLLKKVPLLAGMAALLCTGLIALLMSRRILTAGQYLGGALIACGLLAALGLLIMKSLNLRGMIAEASAALEAQYAHLSGTITLEVLGGAAVLILLGAGLMILARKEYRRDEA